MNSYAETVAALRCQNHAAFPCSALAGALKHNLPKLGYTVSFCETFAEREVVIYCDDMIVSVCKVDDADHEFLVAAETPDPGHGFEEADKMRLLLCAAATRLVCQLMSIESVSWHHRDQFFVTTGKRTFSPLETGERARRKMRKTAASALSTIREMTLGSSQTRIAALIRQHYPSEQDISLGSDYAA